MKIESAKCPECGATVDIKDGISAFRCSHCGCYLDYDTKNSILIKARVRAKEIEHETERIKLANEDKLSEREFKQKDFVTSVKAIMLVIAFMLLVGLAGALSLGGSHTSHVRKMERLVTEIQKDIDDQKYDEAFVKTQSIRGDGYSNEDDQRWKDTRKALEKQIKEAKKKAK